MARKQAVKKQASPTTRAAAQKPLSLRLTLAALGVVLLTIAAYANSVDNGFVWDDHEQIVMNPYVKANAPLAPLFTADVRFAHQGPSLQTKAFRPFQMVTYRFIATAFGNNASAFHATSIAFAALGAIGALLLFWLLTGRVTVAFIAAALFAVHPVHTEAVDWIAALPDLGAGLCILFAFVFFLAAQRTQRIATKIWWTLSIAAFLKGLLWKETAIVFPLLVVAYGMTLQMPKPEDMQRRVTHALKLSSPFWLGLLLYLWVRHEVLGALTAGARDWSLSVVETILTTGQLFLAYWGKLLFPASLNAYVLLHPVHSVTSLAAIAIVVGIVVIIAGVVLLLRRAPLAGFSALWVCILLLPGLNLSALGRNAFAERYLYAASAGFCLLLVLAGDWLASRLPVRYRKASWLTATILILGLFTAQTVARASDWKDDAALFNETLKQSPDAPFVHVMVAATQSTDPSQASVLEENYRQAVTLAKAEVPQDRLDIVEGDEGLATLYASRGDMNQARSFLNDAKQVAGETPDLTTEQGMLLAQSGHGVEAEPLLRRALAVEPQNENVLSALGAIARDVHHDLPAAITFFRQALAAHPELDDFNAAQHSNIAAVYEEANNKDAAIAEMESAVTIAPGDPQYRDNMASALAAAGRFGEARTAAQTALQLDPNDALAQQILQRLAQQP
jgi:Flp pilus assembly protein TadD